MKKFWAVTLNTDGTGQKFVSYFQMHESKEDAIDDAKKKANDTGGTYVVLEPVAAFRPPAPPIVVESVEFED